MSQNTSGEQDTSGSNTSKKNSKDNSAVGIGVGAAGIVGIGGTVVLSSDKVQKSLVIKKIKDASSKFSINLASKIKSGKLAGKIKDVASSGASAVAATKVGGAAIEAGQVAGKAVGKTVGAAGGAALGAGADIVMGGMQIASTAKRNDSSGQKAYKITGDVIGVGVNVAIGFLGPIGLVIMVFQICGAILDAAWDPFKNYFNSDLETMRLGIIDSLKVAYKEADMNYPIETKPDILLGLDEPDSAEYKEYMDLMDTYLADRGFITSEEVRVEEEYFLALKTIRRQRKLYRTNENGELEMQDPDIAAVALLDSATNNDLIMMALAAKYVKNKQRQAKPSGASARQGDLTNKTNYIIGSFLISALFLIFFFLSIFIASI